jgi:hypothetical protein
MVKGLGCLGEEGRVLVLGRVVGWEEAHQDLQQQQQGQEEKDGSLASQQSTYGREA